MSNTMKKILVIISFALFPLLCEASAISNAENVTCERNKTYVIYEASCFSDKCGKAKEFSGDNWLYFISSPKRFNSGSSTEKIFASKIKKKFGEPFSPDVKTCFLTWAKANLYAEERKAELELSDENVISIYW